MIELLLVLSRPSSPAAENAKGPIYAAVAPVGEHILRVRLWTGTPPVWSNALPCPFPPMIKATTWSSQNGDRTLSTHGWKVGLALENAQLQISVSSPGRDLFQQLGFDAEKGVLTFNLDGPVFGLGGGGGTQLDRRGTVYPMTPKWATGQIGSTVPVPLLIGARGWGLFILRTGGTFDLRGERGKMVPAQPENAIELFLVQASEPTTLVGEIAGLVGRPPIPPKWTMGYMQSHRTLAGPEEVLGVARTFRQKQLPCDALIYLGTGYCPAGWNLGHGSIDFNPKTFPNPGDMLRELHALDFKVVLHVNNTPRGLFGNSLTEVSAQTNHIANFWKRHQTALAAGADAWWPDDGDEVSEAGRFARHRLYYEGSLKDHPELRPWSLHRTGTPGVTRFGGWIWSGDIEGQWSTLKSQIAIGLNSSLSLTPFWGSDTGGFYPSSEFSGELYARWFQFSAFTPSFRSHGRTWHLRLPWGWSTNEPGPIEHAAPVPSLPDMRVEPICKEFLDLRYRLLPYNYTLAWQAHAQGLPMMRPLWLHTPEDAEQAASCGDEYLWGANLLVAPVYEPGALQRPVYLPLGRWYNAWTGVPVSGQRTVQTEAPLNRIPLYVRAGTVLPLDPPRQFTAQPVDQPTTIVVFPGADGQFLLYEDDGITTGWQSGAFATTMLKWDDARKSLSIGERQGTYTGMPKEKRLRVWFLKPGEPFDISGPLHGQEIRYTGKALKLKDATR